MNTRYALLCGLWLGGCCDHSPGSGGAPGTSGLTSSSGTGGQGRLLHVLIPDECPRRDEFLFRRWRLRVRLSSGPPGLAESEHVLRKSSKRVCSGALSVVLPRARTSGCWTSGRGRVRRTGVRGGVNWGTVPRRRVGESEQLRPRFRRSCRRMSPSLFCNEERNGSRMNPAL